MNSRLEALVNRGYPKEVVERLATYTEEELKYASECAFEHISKNCIPVKNPSAIFIGGQPGSGKTVMSMNLKNKIGNAIEIGIDNYRMYHHRYLEMEKCIKEHWKNRKETENDTPGNDIADFTHLFAGAMTDKLIEMGKNSNYNLLLEWGMREPKGPLNCMKELKQKNYNNIVLFVAIYKDISYKACELRANIMKDNRHIIRKVPKNFHDFSVSTLPSSVDEIYNIGYSNKVIDYMALVTRDNNVIWDDKSKESPGNIYNKCLNDNAFIKNRENSFSVAIKTNEREMEGLKNNIQELNDLKQEIIYIHPQVFDINSKIK